MPNTINPTRRRFLRYSALTGAATAFPMVLKANPKSIESYPTPSFKPDVEIEFTARKAYIPILAQGPNTRVQKFYAQLLKGPANTLQPLQGNFLGPILNLVRGQKVRVFFKNRLDEPSIIHWHGLHVPQAADGHPMYSIGPGETYVYEFKVLNRAGTSFYHSHTHELTAEQVYMGLAGLIKVTDKEEQALELPSGEYDIPLVIQDRSFNERNQLQYVHRMHERMLGFLGDTILVNGKPDAEFSVKTRAYRFRALNGSNSRIYKLGWDDGTPLTAIGTDACLLEKPETRPYIMLAPGERVDLWLDFSDRKVGSKLVMYSLPFTGTMPPMYERMKQHHDTGASDSQSGGMMHGDMGMMGGGHQGGMGMGGMGADDNQQGGGMRHGGMGMMGGGMHKGGMMGGMSADEKQQGGGMKHGGMGMMGGGGPGGMAKGGGGMMGMMPGSLPQGVKFPIAVFKVTEKVSDSPALPDQLARYRRLTDQDADNAENPLPIGVSMKPMAPQLNGKSFEMDKVTDSEKVAIGSIKKIRIFHDHGPMPGGHGEKGKGENMQGMQHEGGMKDKQEGMQHGGMGMMGGNHQGGMGMGNMKSDDMPQGGGMQHGGMGMMGGNHQGGMGMGNMKSDDMPQGDGMQHGGMGMKGGGMQMGGGMGMMMGMAHPIHLHGQQYQVLSRRLTGMEAPGYETVKDGFIDSGWKDTVLVMPGEEIQIIKPFQDYKGLFLYHCHNLEHEDLGMMRQFDIE